MFFRAIIFLGHLTSDLLWMVFRAIVFPKPLKELLRLQRCPAKAHNPLKQEPIARRKLSAASLTNGFMDPSLGNQSVVQYMRGFQKGNVWDLYMLEARIDSGLSPRSPTAPHHTTNIFLNGWESSWSWFSMTALRETTPISKFMGLMIDVKTSPDSNNRQALQHHLPVPDGTRKGHHHH